MSVTATKEHSESRGGRRGGPQLFIVVASIGKMDQLDEGLAKLLPAAWPLGAQVLIVGPGTPNRVYALTQQYPGIRYILAAPGLPRHELLSLGVAQTSGGVVVLTDDTMLARENWPQLLSWRLGRAGVEHHQGPRGISA